MSVAEAIDPWRDGPAEERAEERATKPAPPPDLRRASRSTFLLVPITVLFALLVIGAVRSPSLVSQSGIGSAIIVATPLVLATFALTASVLAGRGTVDLSIGPLIGFINVTLIVAHGAGWLQSPITFVLFALSVGVAYQALFALIVIYVRVQPIIVALSGYLALSGLNLVILPRPGGSAPEWMMDWGSGTSVFSPVLAVLLIALGGWGLFTLTAFYGHLRLMGSDERAAFTSGVRITAVRIGAHVIAGLFAALAALCFTALIGSGDPTQGTTFSLIAITALVLGGASLSGGRGTIVGSMLGAINLYLINYVLATFNFGAVQSFVTNLAYGVVLVLSLLVTLALPWLQRRLRYVSPLLYFIILSIVALSVIAHAAFPYRSLPPAEISVAAQDVRAAQDGTPARAAPPFVFVLEPDPLEDAAAEAPRSVRMIALLVVALGAAAALLRVLVEQSVRDRRGIGPAVWIVAGGLALVVAWLAAVERDAPDAAPPSENTR